MAGMGFGLSYAAGAAVDETRQQQRDELEELLKREHMKMSQRIQEREARQDEERRQQWQADHDLRKGTQESLEKARAAQAAKDLADADARKNRQKGLEQFISDPAALNALPPLARLVLLNQHGMTNVGLHDVESADEHGTHVKAEKGAALAEWKDKTDYTEKLRRERPQRATARLVVTDPTLPPTPQLYALEIAQKHKGNFDAAQAEAMAYLSNPQTRSDHPKLSAQKFMEAIRRGMSRPSGETWMERQQQRQAQDKSQQTGGRGGGPGTGNQTSGGTGTTGMHKWSDGTTRAYPESKAATQGRGAPPQQQQAPAKADSAPVKMVAPDGRELMVPPDKVDEAKRRGARIAGTR